jgi:hypothetical protein
MERRSEEQVTVGIDGGRGRGAAEVGGIDGGRGGGAAEGGGIDGGRGDRAAEGGGRGWTKRRAAARRNQVLPPPSSLPLSPLFPSPLLNWRAAAASREVYAGDFPRAGRSFLIPARAHRAPCARPRFFPVRRPPTPSRRLRRARRRQMQIGPGGRDAAVKKTLRRLGDD